MSDSFIEKIKKNGVVGAGGAGFPTHIKLSSKAEYVILNAAECEPLIRVDHELLDHYAQSIIEELDMIVKHVCAKKAFIAIKSKHHEAISLLNKILKDYENIEVFQLKDFYPAGDEQVTVYEILKRVVPQGGIPLNVHTVVINVETVLNIMNSFKDLPVICTYVTVTGQVPEPATYKIPIGVSYREILDICGRSNLEDKLIIDGGPMMGKIITDFDLPVTKTTKAIILLDKRHKVIKNRTVSMEHIVKRSKAACIQCSRCTDLCPRFLLGHDVKPHIVMRMLNYGLKDLEGMKTALGCSECGVCELYACPMDLSPRRVNAMLKQELNKAGIKADTEGKVYSPSLIRSYRRIPVNRLIDRLDLKSFDVNAPIKIFTLVPKKVVILLKQHVGAPSEPIVKVGAEIKEGDLIAEISEGKLGACVHASISGTVTDVTNEAITIEAK